MTTDLVIVVKLPKIGSIDIEFYFKAYLITQLFFEPTSKDDVHV